MPTLATTCSRRTGRSRVGALERQVDSSSRTPSESPGKGSEPATSALARRAIQSGTFITLVGNSEWHLHRPCRQFRVALSSPLSAIQSAHRIPVSTLPTGRVLTPQAVNRVSPLALESRLVPIHTLATTSSHRKAKAMTVSNCGGS